MNRERLRHRLSFVIPYPDIYHGQDTDDLPRHPRVLVLLASGFINRAPLSTAGRNGQHAFQRYGWRPLK